jgi:ParB/RepB/Spo0J family partition protein
MNKQSLSWGNGLKAEMVQLARCRPNPWNPNKMSQAMFEKERLSIRTYGFVEPIKVRVIVNDPSNLHTFEIIDGEHRWKAATAEGMTEVPAINLGIMDDAKAKKLTIIANELRGAPEPVLLAALIKDLTESTTIEDLAKELPMTAVELDSLVKSTSQFDWGAVEATLSDSPAPREASNIGGERRFQLGTAKGSIPTRLHDDLMVEFNRSAAAVGSSNPETVLRDWVERLQATATQVDAQVAARAAAAPAAPAKRVKKAAQS